MSDFFNEKISTTKKQSSDEFSCQRWVLTCAYFAIQFPLKPVVTWRLQLHCEFTRTFLCFDLGKLIPTWMMSISQPWPIRNKKEINSQFVLFSCNCIQCWCLVLVRGRWELYFSRFKPLRNLQ